MALGSRSHARRRSHSRILTGPAIAASGGAKSLWRRGGGAGRSFGGGFALQLHFARGVFFAPGAVIGDRQLIVTCRIFWDDLHVFFERGHGVGKFLIGG